MKEKEAINLKENKKGYQMVWREKREGGNDVIILQSQKKFKGEFWSHFFGFFN